jgi:hypothetical protein
MRMLSSIIREEEEEDSWMTAMIGEWEKTIQTAMCKYYGKRATLKLD